MEKVDFIKNIINITLSIYALINIITFLLFGVDKLKAIKGKWRIRESVLLGFSFFGGALGGILGMRLFHHKTMKKPFYIGIPLMLMLHICLAVVCLVVLL